MSRAVVPIRNAGRYGFEKRVYAPHEKNAYGLSIADVFYAEPDERHRMAEMVRTSSEQGDDKQRSTVPNAETTKEGDSA